jgi:transcriptional regulator GlxA family with amidase domain
MRLIHMGAIDKGSVQNLATRLGVGARHLSRLFQPVGRIEPKA